MSHQSDILMIHPFLFYLFLPFPDNAVQQLLAGIFEKRDDELEVAIVAIIRIGNGGVFAMMGQKNRPCALLFSYQTLKKPWR